MTLSFRGWRLALILALTLVGLAAAPAVASPTPAPTPGATPVAKDVRQMAGHKADRRGFPSGNVYCTPTYKHPHCLTAPTVEHVVGCDANGGRVAFTFTNVNAKDAPIINAVYFNGNEFFGDAFWAPANGVSTLVYYGIPIRTEVKVVVGWPDQGLEFDVAEFTACAKK